MFRMEDFVANVTFHLIPQNKAYVHEIRRNGKEKYRLQSLVGLMFDRDEVFWEKGEVYGSFFSQIYGHFLKNVEFAPEITLKNDQDRGS